MNNVVKSAARVLLVLEYFDQVQREVTLGEVARQLDFPQSSTSMLMRSLVDLGYLYYDRNRRAYGPTTRAALLGNWGHGAVLRNTAVLEIMQNVHRATGETITLSVMNGTYAQYVRVIQQPDNPCTYYLRPGTLRPLFESGAGLLLMSVLPDDQVDILVRRAGAALGMPLDAIRVSTAYSHLKQIREQGYAFTRGLTYRHMGFLGMVLPGGADTPPIGIAISTTLDRFEGRVEKFVDILRAEIVDRFPRETLCEDIATV